MFFGLLLICSATNVQDCDVVSGKFFPSQEACLVDLTTNGMLYVNLTYDRNIHIAFVDCLEADIQGEPT